MGSWVQIASKCTTWTPKQYIHTACSPKTSSRVSEDQVLLADWLPSLFQFQFSTRLSPKASWLPNHSHWKDRPISISNFSTLKLFALVIHIHNHHSFNSWYVWYVLSCKASNLHVHLDITDALSTHLDITMGIVLGNCSAQLPKASESTSRFDVEASSGAKNESSLGEKVEVIEGWNKIMVRVVSSSVNLRICCVCVCPAFLGDLPWIGVGCLSSSESSLCILLFCSCPRAEVFFWVCETKTPNPSAIIWRFQWTIAGELVQRMENKWSHPPPNESTDAHEECQAQEFHVGCHCAQTHLGSKGWWTGTFSWTYKLRNSSVLFLAEPNFQAYQKNNWNGSLSVDVCKETSFRKFPSATLEMILESLTTNSR